MARVLVTGGTGFLGRAVILALLNRGDQVSVFSRDVRRGKRVLPRAARVVAWTPGQAGPWHAELSAVDAVVHLAGAPIAQRWSEAHRARLITSRVDTTRSLVAAIGEVRRRPRVLISASGTGYYGADRGREELVEDSAPGNDFIAKLCIGWEREARGAGEHAVRAVQLRLGAVVGRGAGMLESMIQLGGALVGGPIGKGDNTLAWVHVLDVVDMVLMAMDDARISGPMNCTSPIWTTQAELARAMGSVMGRPVLGAPKAVMRAALGGMVDVVCGSLCVVPERLAELGYGYHHAQLLPALEDALAPR